MLVLISCGSPPEPIGPTPLISVPAPDAAPLPSPLRAAVEDLGVERVDEDTTSIAWATAVITCGTKAVTELHAKSVALAPGESVAWCENQCVVVASKKANQRLDVGTGARTELPIPPLLDPTTLSMSADCQLAAFRVPPSGPEDVYETWDVSLGKKVRASKSWPVAGGAFSAELVASGRFLRWTHSRGLDVYDETKSGVKGPGIGLATAMSPDDRFLFVGGGMTFGTNQDTPSELLRSKDGTRVYAVPKPPQQRLSGTFCPSSRVLATIEPKAVVLRTTDDPKPIATLAIRATKLAFSPKGDALAAFDSDSKTVHIYRLHDVPCAP